MKPLLLILSLSVAKPEPLSKEVIKHQSTWISGQNFPENTPIEYLEGLNGARDDPSAYDDLEVKVHNVSSEIPEVFDARKHWSQCESLRDIRNQGSCGSCWAFGAVEAMTDRLCIATNATKKFKFSAQDLLSCCTECGDGCAGGHSSRAWSYWVNNGIVSGGDYNSNEGCQPYTESPFESSTTPQCLASCQNNYKISYDQDKHYGVSSYRISSDVKQIQTEILESGPVQTSYTVYEDFYSYKSGIYQHIHGNVSGRHAVKILGWGTTNGTPYWLAANSWGVTWGDLGFFKILRGGNHCDIENNILGGQPKVI